MFALVFPGQGAQREGFFGRLPAHPEVERTVAEAAEVLGEPVSESRLQLALLVAGVGTARALVAEGLHAGANAGLSVGAFAAAVSAGALAFDDALRLVARRAELMESAFPSGYGLSAVSGLREPEVLALAQGRVYVANVNAPRQIVVAGADAELEAMNARALAAGARKATRLDVKVPSHCPLLVPAAAELGDLARSVPFRAPSALYVGNRGGRPLRTGEAIRDDLVDSLRSTVRWFDALTVLVELGARVLVEAPPGTVSTDIAREAFPEVPALAADSLPFSHLVATVKRRADLNPGDTAL